MIFSSPRILMLVTNHAHIDTTHPTGLWFEEFAIPYTLFKAHGLEITVASPRGGQIPLDPGSELGQNKDISTNQARQALLQTQALSKIEATHFTAIFLPGGHGTMFDLPENILLQNLLGTFAREEKIIAAVCHGPAGLVGAYRSDGIPVVAGKTLTSFTNDEERAVGLDGLLPFLLESKLRDLGAHFVARPNWSDHVERDGNLITGQNPQSSQSVALSVIDALHS